MKVLNVDPIVFAHLYGMFGTPVFGALTEFSYDPPTYTAKQFREQYGKSREELADIKQIWRARDPSNFPKKFTSLRNGARVSARATTQWATRQWCCAARKRSWATWRGAISFSETKPSYRR